MQRVGTRRWQGAWGESAVSLRALVDEEKNEPMRSMAGKKQDAEAVDALAFFVTSWNR